MSLIDERKSGYTAQSINANPIYPDAVWLHKFDLGTPDIDGLEFEIYARESERSIKRIFDIPFSIEIENGSVVLYPKAVNHATRNAFLAPRVFITCEFTEILTGDTYIVFSGEVDVGLGSISMLSEPPEPPHSCDFNLLNQQPLGSDPGSINYDPVKGTMNVRNIFPGSSIQVGQESVIFVVNNTGSDIVAGGIVSVTGYDSVSDALEIELAIADIVGNQRTLGVTTTDMPSGATGLVTSFGRVNDLDTSGFSEGALIYLSSTNAGAPVSSKPAIAIQIGFIGKSDPLNGFIQVDIRELEKSIYGSYSHSLNQSFSQDLTGVIAFDTIVESSGIEHSVTIEPEHFTFINAGVYQSTIEPQYTRISGGGTDVVNVFLAKDTGSGFVNVPGSNVKFSVNSSGNTNSSPLTATFRVNAGDVIGYHIQVEDSDLILESFPAAGIAPNEIPLTPSVSLNIVRIGD